MIWVDDDGRSGLFGADGEPTAEVRRLLAAGLRVVGLDLLLQGDHHPPGSRGAEERNRLVPEAEGAAFTFGYNHPLFVQRVHDLLTAIRYLRSPGAGADSLHLVGLGGLAGPLAAAVRAQAPEALRRVAIDTGGFRFARVERVDDAMFLPGAAKYLDLPGLLALGVAGALEARGDADELWLAGEGEEAPPLVAAAHRAAGRSHRLQLFAGEEARAAAVEWLLEGLPAARASGRDGGEGE